MDPLTIPLAGNCRAEFARISRPLTERFGDPAEGLVYRDLTLVDARGTRRVLVAGSDEEGVTPSAYWEAGPSPDGRYLAYLAITVGAASTANDMRFVAAATCDAVRFVRVPDGRALGGGEFTGWQAGAPHTIALLRGRVALPVAEVPGAE